MAFREWMFGGATALADPEPPRHVADDTRYVQARELATFTVDSELLALFGGTVGKSVALRVPAFARAYQIYTHTISCFPLRERVDRDLIAPRGFLVNPSQFLTYPALMSRTIGDLVCHDVAYWRITSRAWDGYPNTAEWMPFADVAVHPSASLPVGVDTGNITLRGVPVPARDVIRFDGDGTGGWLTTGVNAIAQAAELESSTLRTSQTPSPSLILKNSGADLSPTQVDALLTAWETARADRSTAYLNSSIAAETLAGWSPNDLQLVEARNASAAMIARLTNLDPVWVGAGVPGSTLTYANRVDLRKDLVDLALRGPMAWVESRLSAPDVTPRGHTVTFDPDVFLRANTTDAAAVAKDMVPLGVMTTDEARDLLDVKGPLA